MKIFVDGYQASGHPKEIAELLLALRPTVSQAPVDSELEKQLAESAKLRQKLEENPSYNPFPGAIPGEPEPVQTQTVPTRFSAEMNTGVQNG